MLQTILRDLRFAARVLRQSPVFTVVAVLVITIGTGAVTTIFSVANAVALRPLPGVTNLDEVVAVRRALPDGTGDNWVSYPLYRYLRDGAATRPAADVAAWSFMPLTINPGEVRTLDNILQSFFGLSTDGTASNLGGAVHVATAGSSNLVVTGRTYNRTSEGTFGQ